MKSIKFLSLLLSVLLVISLFPISVSAEDSEHQHTDGCCEENVMSVDEVSTVSTIEVVVHAPGDVDGDSDFDIDDIVIIKKIILGVIDTIELIEAADCSGDYNTDVLDFIRLNKHLVSDFDPSLLTYTIEDNEAYITGYNGFIAGAVTIPSSISGHKVVGIADGAFKNCALIESLLLPATIETIGDSAFENCTSLISLALSDNVTYIGKKAFYNCGNLFAIKLPKNITSLEDDIFKNCYLLSVIEIPENVEEIGEGAFYACSSLVELNIPEKVTVLNDYTFAGCSKLAVIGLPENLKEIKNYTFYSCNALESVTIPITVATVGDCAFSACNSLLSIVVPYETAFGSNVFDGCSMLVVKGVAGTGAIDAAVNSGVKYETLECGHNEYLLLYAVNPTCEKEGYSGDVFCVGCGKIEQKGYALPKSGHNREIVGKKEATCEGGGYTGMLACTLCKTVFAYGFSIEPTGHWAQEMPGYVPATCTTDGVYGTFTCENCGEYIDNEVIPTLGHDYYITGRRYADCVNEGYTGDLKCYDCDFIELGEVEPAGLHLFKCVNEVYATCTSEGYTGDYVCKGCGLVDVVGKVIEKEPHTIIAENYKAATCTEKGYSGDSKCADCGTEFDKGYEIPLLGHITVLINYRNATCTQEGYSGEQICSVCGVLVSAGKAIPKTEHKIVLANQKDATDTSNGYTGDKVCEICGTVFEEGSVIPADHEHTVVIKNEKNATCGETGYTGDSVCDECGFVLKEGTAIDKLPHNFGESQVVDATCTTDGYSADICKDCGYKYIYDKVLALGHDYSSEVFEPNCTEKGYTNHSCTRCDDSYKADYIDALGHNLGETVNDKDATCTKDGYTGDRVCSICGETVYGETVEATGHNYNSVVTDPTCKEKGFTTYTCTVCGYSYIDDYTDLSDHNLGEPINAKKATCTEDGYTGDRVCSVCGETVYGETVEATGHNYNSVVTDPTCKEQGFTTHTCTVCGDSYTDGYTELSDHDYGEPVNVKSATCTEDGYTGDKVCSVCGETVYGETQTKLGHDYKTVVTAPTCTEQGYTTHTCDRCSNSYKDTYTDITGHIMVNGRCTVCGEVETIIVESSHPYSNNIDKYWETYHDGVAKMSVTFSSDTYTESNWDFIYIYDKNGSLVGKYSGSQLANKTIEVEGDTVKIRLTSDSSNTKYGFVATITPIYDNCSCGGSFTTVIEDATCTQNGIKRKICTNCGQETTTEIAATGHNWTYDSTVQSATCTQDGIRCEVCTNCSETRETVIYATGHSWSHNSDYSYCCNCYMECYHDSDEETDDYYCSECGADRCYYCYMWGHYDFDCPNVARCDSCGGVGHYDFECPNSCPMCGGPKCPMCDGTGCPDCGYMGCPSCGITGGLGCPDCGGIGCPMCDPTMIPGDDW